MARDQRRLAAIISADVAGYSRLMGRDDSGTLAALKAHRRELIDPKIAEYGGRIVKTTGDGLLLEFPSVVDAVRCAVDVQRAMAERNSGVPADRRIDFRIGINLGDIIIDGEDIFGDGVNVAARLQALAEPGEICVSKVVRDQVLDKLSFTFEDLGAQKVKNIARPVEAFRVDLGHETLPASGGRAHWQRTMRFLEWRRVGAGLIAIAVVAIAFWILRDLWKPAAAPKPAPLSVVMVPLVAAEGDPDASRFAEALTRDLVSRLGRMSGSAGRMRAVLSKGDAPGRKSSINPSELGRSFHSRYMLDGNVLRINNLNTVNLRLVDAATGGRVWSARETLRDSDLSAESSSRVQSIGRQMRSALVQAEQRRVNAEPLSGLSASELVLRAMAVPAQNPSLAGTLEARKLVDQALRLDPNLVPALLMRANLTEDEYYTNPKADRTRLSRELDEDSRRAVELDPGDYIAWGWRGTALAHLGRWDAALEANAKAIKLEPDEPEVYRWRGEILNQMGRPAEALPLIERALAMDPNEAGLPMLHACLSRLLLGRVEDAVSTCESASALNDWWWPRILLLAAYGNHGDTEKAATVRAEFLRLMPGYTVAQARAADQPWNAEYDKLAEKYIYDGLRKAGIPER